MMIIVIAWRAKSFLRDMLHEFLGLHRLHEFIARFFAIRHFFYMDYIDYTDCTDSSLVIHYSLFAIPSFFHIGKNRQRLLLLPSLQKPIGKIQCLPNYMVHIHISVSGQAAQKGYAAELFGIGPVL